MGRARIAMWAVLVAAALSSSWAFRHRPAPPGLPDPEFDSSLLELAHFPFKCGTCRDAVASCMVKRNPERAAWYLRNGNADEKAAVAYGFLGWTEYSSGDEVAIPALEAAAGDPAEDDYVRECATTSLARIRARRR